jgi:hypothetical protein
LIGGIQIIREAVSRVRLIYHNLDKTIFRWNSFKEIDKWKNFERMISLRFVRSMVLYLTLIVVVRRNYW